MGFHSAQGRAGWWVATAMTAAVLLGPADARAAWSPAQPVSAAPPPQAQTAEVVVDRDGTATAAWITANQVWAARRPHGSGWGTPELVSDESVDEVHQLEIARGTAGDVVIGWLGFSPADVSLAQVVTRAAGDDAYSDPATVSDATTAIDMRDLAVAAGHDGRMAALWVEDENGPDVVRETTTTGPAAAWDDPQTLNVPAGNIAGHPEVGFDRDGDATAAWSTYQAPGNVQIEFADRAAGGTTWTVGAVPGTQATNSLIFPLDLAINGDGDVAIVYYRYVGQVAPTFAARRPAGGVWDVDPVSATEDTGLPEVVLDEAGNATAAWIATPDDVSGAGGGVRSAFAPEGGDWTAPDDVQMAGTVWSFLTLDSRPDGRALLSWGTRADIWTAERQPGAEFAAPELVSDQNERDPRVAYDPRGGAVAVWTDPAGRVQASERSLDVGDALAFVNDGGSLRRAAPSGAGNVAITSPDGEHDHRPAWSPDGERLAFDSDRSGTQELWTIGPSGEGMERVPGPNGGINQGQDPTWSPDGASLAFTSIRDGRVCPSCAFNTEIYRVPVGGGAAERLTENSVFDTEPAWSPDGSTIAFVRSDGANDSDIWLMDADGSNQRPFLEDEVYNDSDPAWSADGTRLAWARSADGGTNVWVANADGSDAGDVTSGREPTWSPSCLQLAVTRTTPGEAGEEGSSSNDDIYLAPVSGPDDDIQVTTDPADDEAAAWRPVGVEACPDDGGGEEPVPPAVSIGDAAVTERDGLPRAVDLTLTLDQAPENDVSVRFAAVDGTARQPRDYKGAGGLVTFPAGESSATVTVSVEGDRLDEGTEHFFVDLSQPDGLTIADPRGQVTITDNDPPPAIEGYDAYALETAPAIAFPVELRRASGKPVTISYRTSDHSAHAPGDYAARTGTVVIPAGQTAGEIRVTLRDDQVREADYERFHVTLDSASAPLVARQLVGTIVDDERGPAPAPRYPDDEQARSAAPGPGSASPQAGPPLVPRLVLAAGPLRPRADGTVVLRMRCTDTTACRGTVRLLRRGRAIGRARVAVRAGRVASARVRLTRSARRALRRSRRMQVQVEVTLGGVRSVRTATLTRKVRKAR